MFVAHRFAVALRWLWDALGTLWGRSGDALETLWGRSGALWGALGFLWDALVALWGRSGGALELTRAT